MSELALGQAFGEGLKSFPRTILIYACVALVGAIGLTAVEIATTVPEPSIFPKTSTPTPDEYPPAGLYTPDGDISALVAVINRPRARDGLALQSDFMDFQSHAVAPWPASSTIDLPATSAFLIRAASMPNRTFESLFEWSALAWKSDPMSSQSVVAVQSPGGTTYHGTKSGPVAHRGALSTFETALSGANAPCATLVRGNNAQDMVDGFYGQDMSHAGVRRNAALPHCADRAPIAAAAATATATGIHPWGFLIGILLRMGAQ